MVCWPTQKHRDGDDDDDDDDGVLMVHFHCYKRFYSRALYVS